MQDRCIPPIDRQTCNYSLGEANRSRLRVPRLTKPAAIALLFWVAAVSTHGWAQEDPFSSGDVFGAASDPSAGFGDLDAGSATAPTTTTPTQDDLPENANIVVRMLREEPPQGLLEIARAVQLTTRLKEWSEVGRYLDQLTPLVTSAAQAETLTETFGSDLWLRLASEKTLNETQRQFASRILDLVSHARSNPQTISSAVQNLKSASAVERKRAAIRLQQAGAAGLLAVITAISDGSLPPTAIVVDLIDSFGQSGVDALSAALDTSDVQRYNRLLYAATAFIGKGLLPQITLAIHDPSIHPENRRAIEQLLLSKGRPVPTAAQTRDYAAREIGHELNLSRAIPNDGISENLTPVWLLDASGQAVQLVQANPSTYHLQKAAEKSIALLRTADVIDEAAVIAAVALLQRDYAVDQFVRQEPINLRSGSPLGQRAGLFANRKADWAYWVSVYRSALINGFHAAELRALQQLGSLPTESHLHGDVTDVLLTAADSTVPAVRYAALEILFRSKPLQAIPQVAHALAKAKQKQTQFVGFPTALVVGGSPELRQIAIDQLLELGIESLEASSGREAVRQIQRFTPLEFVLVVDRLYDQPVSETVQRIAAFPATSAIPIAILTPNLTESELVVLRESPRLVYGTLTLRENYMPSVIKRMNSLADIPLPSRSDRLVWTGMLSEPQAD